jgi:16S rRNA (cytosine967-C5)-methyltransferase
VSRRGGGRGRGKRRGRKGGKGAGPPQRDEAASPRRLAASIVRGVLEGRGAARTHLERAAERDGATRQGLVTELVYGTIRHLATLDRLLGACAPKGLRKVEDAVLAHLRVAAYQLVFLTEVPAAVAVSEAVKAAGSRPHVRGFVNGLLRGLERKIASKPKDDAPPLGVPSTHRLPGRDGGWVVLSAPLLPAAEEDPAAWLAAAASLPTGLAQSWVEAFGLDGALEVARAQNAPPPTWLRVNRLRTTREELLERLRAGGVDAEPGPAEASILLPGGLMRGDAEAGIDQVWAGLATPQDLTAMQVAPFLDPQAGERVVDLCAAPGGKATHLVELMGDEGRVDALDVEADRLERVERAASRLGLRSLRCHLADPADPRPPEGPPVDRVLADVPCSNTGVLRRRVEVRWRLARLDWAPLLALQARLLDRAVELARPGGVVVYSTCSIERRENQDQVAALLARRPGLTLEEERLTLPRRGRGDGGYVAKVRVGTSVGN